MTTLTVISLLEMDPLYSWGKEFVSPELPSVVKVGGLGTGTMMASVPSMETTEVMVGLSWALSWTHRRPTWTHLVTSLVEMEPLIAGSTSSVDLSSFHSCHAWKKKRDERLYCLADFQGFTRKGEIMEGGSPVLSGWGSYPRVRCYFSDR